MPARGVKLIEEKREADKKKDCFGRFSDRLDCVAMQCLNHSKKKSPGEIPGASSLIGADFGEALSQSVGGSLIGT
jgi:hypothetical protein